MVLIVRWLFVFSVFGLMAQTGNNNWKYVGPKSNIYQYKGLFTSVWADEENLNNVLAGSSCGGLFATYNALNDQPIWENITDNLPYMNFGISGIVVKKNTNNKTIYISTNTGGGILTQGFGNGIFYTIDGGLHWQQIGPKGKTDSDFPLCKIIANPENQDQMVAFNQRDFFITEDAWKTFVTIKLPFHKDEEKEEITDAEYAPFEDGKIYVTTKVYSKNKAQLFVSNDHGNNWKDITPSDVACERIAIGTIRNPKFKGKFYITSGNKDIVIKYYNGLVFSPPLNTIPVRHLGASSFWCLQLKVNSVDTSVMYLSLTETSVSNDGGKSFRKIGFYNGANTHADIRDMILPKCTITGKYDRLILANDGGISVSNNFDGASNLAFRSLNGIGLSANQFWGIDVLQSDSLYIAGGTQDNGGFFIKEHKEGNNLFVCGDGYYGLVLNDSIALVLGNPPNFLSYNINNGSGGYITIPDPNCEARRPLLLKDSFIYIGYHDLWRVKTKEFVRTNSGFKNISNLPKKTDSIYGIQNRELKVVCISKSNKALLAYTNPNWNTEKNEGKLYYCNNLLGKNPEYIDISPIAGNKYVSLCRWWQVESIIADEQSENTFYMVYKDVNNSENSDVYKFIYYPDSNKAELTMINYNLKRIGFNKLKVDKQTNTLYLASNDGIYYLKLNGEDTTWKSLNFFPKVIVSDIVFNYYTNSIYVATFGRGIWGSQILSMNSIIHRISRSKIEVEPVKVDGITTIAGHKKYQINSKLIITKNSKIELKRKAKLILKEKNKVVDENNNPINLEDHVTLQKGAQIVYLSDK